MYGGDKSVQLPTPRWASWWPRVAFLWENELLHFYAYSLIKYTYYQLGNTEIGTQALQKRKSWDVRAWELVGTEFPRWGAIAHLSLDPLIYVYPELQGPGSRLSTPNGAFKIGPKAYH